MPDAICEGQEKAAVELSREYTMHAVYFCCKMYTKVSQLDTVYVDGNELF